MIDDQRIEAIITRTLESQPDDATHWSSRGMARDSGLSVSTVQRIWRAFGLKPHRQETFSKRCGVGTLRQVSPLWWAVGHGQHIDIPSGSHRSP
jgi:hypothetical protein